MNVRTEMLLTVGGLAVVYLVNAVLCISASPISTWIGILLAVVVIIPFLVWFWWEGKRSGFLDILLGRTKQ